MNADPQSERGQTSGSNPGSKGNLFWLLLRLLLIDNGLLAALQLLTVINQRQTYAELAIPSGLVVYLGGSALIKLILSALAIFGTKKTSRPPYTFAWGSLGFGFMTYWAEYFFLWHPDQKSVFPFFTLFWQGIGLVILTVYSHLSSRLEASDGSGN